MTKNKIALGLIILLYGVTFILFLLALGGYGSPLDKAIPAVFGPILLGFLGILSVVLFAWSILEVKNGNRMFRAILLLSGLYIIFYIFATMRFIATEQQFKTPQFPVKTK